MCRTQRARCIYKTFYKLSSRASCTYVIFIDSFQKFFPLKLLSRFRLRSTRTWKLLPFCLLILEEDSFRKGTPRGIILQLVNSCPHPVSRTLCASSSSFFPSCPSRDTQFPFLFFILFFFFFALLGLLCSIELKEWKESEKEKK